jgi:hypothetical protein
MGGFGPGFRIIGLQRVGPPELRLVRGQAAPKWWVAGLWSQVGDRAEKAVLLRLRASAQKGCEWVYEGGKSPPFDAAFEDGKFPHDRNNRIKLTMDRDCAIRGGKLTSPPTKAGGYPEDTFILEWKNIPATSPPTEDDAR